MRRGLPARLAFGKKHDMKSPCPLPPETPVRVRVSGLGQTLIGRAKEFHWISPDLLNPQEPWKVDLSAPVPDAIVPDDCSLLALLTVAEYDVIPEDMLGDSTNENSASL